MFATYNLLKFWNIFYFYEYTFNNNDIRRDTDGSRKGFAIRFLSRTVEL